MDQLVTSRALTVLVHADSKVGKSTLSITTPAPRLILDGEMAYRFLAELTTQVFWDPMTERPPEPGFGRIEPSPNSPVVAVNWDTCVVIVREYSTLARAVDWLHSGAHPFVSVTIDSISEIQKRCKDQMAGLGAEMDQKKWGALLDHMERLVRGLRDLTEHPIKPLQAVVLTSMTTNRDGKWRPYVQGQLAVTMPYFLDVIGYLYVEEVPAADPTQPGTKIRRLLVSPHPQFEAGERVQGRLGVVVDEPNISTMIDMIFGPITQGVTQ